MNRVEIIHQYDLIVSNLAEDIKVSHYKLQFFLDLLKIKRGFFYKKIKEKRFTSDEVIKLSRFIYPEEHESYKLQIISKLLSDSQKEIDLGKLKDINRMLSK